MSKDKVHKPQPVSGFPELLPAWRRLEQQWMDHFRTIYESYGYTNIETPAVEDVNVLQAKGDINKEIYGLRRLMADEEASDESRLALLFDLTVPLARYTAQHFNELDFPFKRYAMQKVWRGERPQFGREREFTQCDIDVIAVDNLPLHFDAEIPMIIHEIFSGLNLGRTQIRISNRKILMGYFQSLNIEDSTAMLQHIDKIDKLGEENVSIAIGLELKLLNIDTKIADEVMELIKTTDIKSITASNAVMQEGIEELAFVIDQLKDLPEGAAVADLSITRGLDYYTGTVYETTLLDMPEFTSSVCSGGRYDDLAGRFINRKLPGVGISIGLTRLFSVLMKEGKLVAPAPTPTQILVVLPSEEQRAEAVRTASTLRARGFNVELYHAPQKIGKQFGYATKKSIPFVWIPPFEKGQDHEIKDMNTGEQIKADPKTWKL